MKTKNHHRPQGSRGRERGFTLIEVLIAALILTVGLVSLLAVFGVAAATTATSQQNMIAKQLADNALESIFTARNSNDLGWDEIQNFGTGGGIFLTGYQPIMQPGTDGIYGTTDDNSNGNVAEFLTLPGADGLVGTADDQRFSLTGFQRQIAIGAVTGTGALRTITITIRYSPRPQFSVYKTYVLQSYISQYR